MKVAREFFERAMLFVVKNDEVRGLGGFGLAPRDETLNLVARQVAIPLGQPSLFRDVALNRRAVRRPAAAGPLDGAPDAAASAASSRARWRSCPWWPTARRSRCCSATTPRAAGRSSGWPPSRCSSSQAGIALENVFLQRKLQSIEERDRAGLR